MRLAGRLWHHPSVANPIPLRFVVEGAGLACPQALDDFDICRGALVALAVRQDLESHHSELALAPSTDHVESPSAIADMVERGSHLCRDQRMKDRHVDSRKDLDARGRSEQRARPGHGLERGPEKISLAAVALPL